MKKVLLLLLLLLNLQITIRQGWVFLEMGQISAQRQYEETILEGSVTVNKHQDFVYCQYCNKQYSITDISRHEQYECPNRITVNATSRKKAATRSGGDDDYRNYYCCICMRPARCCSCTGPEVWSNWVYDPTLDFDIPYTPPIDDTGWSNTSTSSSKWNYQKAVDWLNKHSRSFEKYQNLPDKEKGKCAQYIRQALEAAGINTNGHPYAAKDYGDFLKSRGFNEVSPNGYTPQEGDIRVWQPYPGGSKEGHINMFNGDKWASDFVEPNRNGPNKGYRAHPNYKTYRK